MNQRFKHYLKKFKPAATDQTMLDKLRQEMEKAVPKITSNIRQREELAAELRIAASRSSQSRNKNKDD